MKEEEFSEKISSFPPRRQAGFLREAIRLLEGPKAPFLISLVKNESNPPTLRRAAVEMLADAGPETVALFRSLCQDPHPTVAKSARLALNRYNEMKKSGSSLTTIFLRKMSSTKEKHQKIKLLKALAMVHSPWVADALADALADPSQEIQEVIIRELSQREGLDIETLYQKASKSPWYVKSAFLRVLGIKKPPDAALYIRRFINDANADVRIKAAGSLAEAGGKEAFVLLIHLKKDKNPYVRTAAKKALEKISDPKFS